MSQTKKLSRREFLHLSAYGAAGLALAACAQATTTTEVAAPATATTAPVQEAAATPTPIPAQEATATLVPTAAVSKEAPALAELVAAGKLPPLEERLPKVPLTLSPVDEIGTYGGRWRTMWSGSWVGFFLEQQYGHSALRWIDDGLGIAPGMCDTWSANADNSEWTLHVR